MLQSLQIAFSQVKACNTSENMLNEILQVIHSLCRANEIIKKVHNNIIGVIPL